MKLTPSERQYLVGALRDSARAVLTTHGIDQLLGSAIELTALCEEIARNGSQHVVLTLEIIEGNDSAAVLESVERHAMAEDLRRQLARSSDGTPLPSADTKTGPMVSGPTAELVQFAREVQRALLQISYDPSQRYGARKVYLVALYGAMCNLHRTLVSWEGFKANLLAANRTGLLELARADLVAAMPADAIRASELTDNGATYHFVIDVAAREPWEGQS